MCPITSRHHPWGRSNTFLPTVTATSTLENPLPHSLSVPIFLNFELPSYYLAKQVLNSREQPQEHCCGK